MLKIGLTGGIGSGKSTVTQLFSELKVPIIDADTIAHQLVEPGKPAIDEIARQFGKKILTDQGALDRKRLREIVFSDPEQKETLEKILHPLVFLEIESQIKRLSYPYCILSIPLLLETHMEHFVDRILVIDCPVDIQFERVKNRDQLNDAVIKSIITSQATREQRLEAADDIIDNSNDTQALAEQVKKLHNQYISLA